ncbi:hypothetical protein TNCV_1691541 [Trichonephila clavipes]|nr:hypothetical protein TNCV_1691541 [Trichonephila clavipes]
MEPNDILANLKQKRSTTLSTVTRLITKVKDVPQCINMDYEVERSEAKTKELSKVDEEMHNLQPDDDYEQDLVECEKYEDNAKITIFLAKKKIRADNF